jgi:hypothetical protein
MERILRALAFERLRLLDAFCLMLLVGDFQKANAGPG